MKLIAHRGNITGPDFTQENSPEYIENALESGYDVEIDIRYDKKTDSLFLGHDEPQYKVSLYWLAGRMDNLWIHCKNIDALDFFVTSTGGFNYFWHQNDDFTLTSKKYIWTYPGKPYTPKSIIVMPENVYGLDIESLRAYNCYGICSDFVGNVK
jgi:hypothetical protein